MGSDYDEDDELGGMPEAVGASFEEFDEDNPELDYYSEGSEPDEVETWRERANDAVEEVRAPRSQQGCANLASVLQAMPWVRMCSAVLAAQAGVCGDNVQGNACHENPPVTAPSREL